MSIRVLAEADPRGVDGRIWVHPDQERAFLKSSEKGGRRGADRSYGLGWKGSRCPHGPAGRPPAPLSFHTLICRWLPPLAKPVSLLGQRSRGAGSGGSAETRQHSTYKAWGPSSGTTLGATPLAHPRFYSQEGPWAWIPGGQSPVGKASPPTWLTYCDGSVMGQPGQATSRLVKLEPRCCCEGVLGLRLTAAISCL